MFRSRVGRFQEVDSYGDTVASYQTIGQQILRISGACVVAILTIGVIEAGLIYLVMT